MNAAGGGSASEPASATPGPPPRVTDVAITSDPGADETYVTGDRIEVTVTFDQAVTAERLALLLDLDIGDNRRRLLQWSASSGPTVLLQYTVLADDRDADGVSIPADNLRLFSQALTIRSAAGVDAELEQHEAVPADPRQRVNVFVPDKPGGLLAQAGNGEVALSWTAGGDGGSAIVRHQYRVKEGNGAYGVWRDIATSAAGEAHAGGYTVAGLDNGALYTFRVRAVNAVGGGPASEPASATPGPPPRVTGVAITSEPGADGTYVTGDRIEVTVTFDQAVTAERLALLLDLDIGDNRRRLLQWSASSGPTVLLQYTVLADDRDADGVSIPADNLRLFSQALTIRSAAGVDAELGHAAVPADPRQRVNVFVPDKPGGLLAQAGNGEVALSWTAGGDGGSAIVRHQYRVKEGNGAYGVWRDIATSAAGEAHAGGYTVAGLDNGALYTFRVRAVNAVGGGPASEPASATPGPPPRVTGVAITSEPGADGPT